MVCCFCVDMWLADLYNLDRSHGDDALLSLHTSPVNLLQTRPSYRSFTVASGPNPSHVSHLHQ